MKIYDPTKRKVDAVVRQTVRIPDYVISPLVLIVVPTKALAKRPAAFPRVALTSSSTGAGIAELRAEIALATGVLPGRAEAEA